MGTPRWRQRLTLGSAQAQQLRYCSGAAEPVDGVFHRPNFSVSRMLQASDAYHSSVTLKNRGMVNIDVLRRAKLAQLVREKGSQKA